MKEFDARLHGALALDQIADIYLRMGGLEEALISVVDAMHRLDPELLTQARTAARLTYQQARDRSPMASETDQTLMLRYLAQKLHVLETPEQRRLQRPALDD